MLVHRVDPVVPVLLGAQLRMRVRGRGGDADDVPSGRGADLLSIGDVGIGCARPFRLEQVEAVGIVHCTWGVPSSSGPNARMQYPKMSAPPFSGAVHLRLIIVGSLEVGSGKTTCPGTVILLVVPDSQVDTAPAPWEFIANTR